MLLIFWKSGRETSKYHSGWIILILMANWEIEMSGNMDQKFKGKKSGLWTMQICEKNRLLQPQETYMESMGRFYTSKSKCLLFPEAQYMIYWTYILANLYGKCRWITIHWASSGSSGGSKTFWASIFAVYFVGRKTILSTFSTSIGYVWWAQRH